ncbi:MAG: thiamine pyrophosphate-dependent enzyme, partial [Oscillospiraceae bacterium]
CTSIWGGPAATSPYTVDKKGKGPAGANSLVEDNAEHGVGLHLGQKTIRERLIGQLIEMMNGDKTPEATKALIKTFLDTRDDGALNPPAVDALIPALEAAKKAGCPVAGGILQEQEYLVKKSTWIFGGDGWAYDIGYGGLDHVLSTGEDVNVMVFDTEVYSNTGGQASKASNIGQVAQFAAAGKSMAKKSLAEIVMQYGYVYVAQVAMGANQNQTLAAIREAEAYHGPSLVIGYSPCEMHSI